MLGPVSVKVERDARVVAVGSAVAAGADSDTGGEGDGLAVGADLDPGAGRDGAASGDRDDAAADHADRLTGRRVVGGHTEYGGGRGGVRDRVLATRGAVGGDV